MDFGGPFSLEKTGGINPPKNPQQNSDLNLGVSRRKSTLQGSGLEDHSQVGFRGSNASGGRIVLHDASKMAALGASLPLCILQCFRAWEGMLPPGARRTSRASARRIVSCKCLCASSLCPPRSHIWGFPIFHP